VFGCGFSSRGNERDGKKVAVCAESSVLSVWICASRENVIPTCVLLCGMGAQICLCVQGESLCGEVVSENNISGSVWAVKEFVAPK
jgi:hypothetical protein